MLRFGERNELHFSQCADKTTTTRSSWWYLSHFGILSTNSDSQEHRGVNPEFHPVVLFTGHILTGSSSTPFVRQRLQNGWFYTIVSCYKHRVTFAYGESCWKGISEYFPWESLHGSSTGHGSVMTSQARIGKVERLLMAGSLCYVCVCTCCMFIPYIVHS